MTTRKEAYPLAWPIGRPRTTVRARSRFDTGWGSALGFLSEEVRRLAGQRAADEAVLSTNVPLRLDGQPRGDAARVGDPGVAIYFTYKKREVCFACDRWDRVHDNIYAIAKTIEALRGIARWGTGEMLEAAFRGFAALPAAIVTQRPWREVLGACASLDEAERSYREHAHVAHPDRGGSHDAMAELNAAITDARRELVG